MNVEKGTFRNEIGPHWFINMTFWENQLLTGLITCGVNSTQNYCLTARMLIFCDIRDKSAVFNILRQNVTIFDIGNG